jgi:tetratricopeptide (TPR) repeat protein
MYQSSLSSRILGLGIPVLLLAATAHSQQQQQPAQPAPSPGPGQSQPGPGTSPGTPGRPGQNPGQQQPFPGRDQQQQMPDMMQNRPIMLSGKVVMQDGTPPPELVLIERVCNGVARPEGYTDSKGRFSFQLGQNQSMLPDASMGSDTGLGRDMGMNSGRGGFGGQNRGISERDLIGCEIRAALPGFRSAVVQLAGRRSLDNPEVGTIILERLAKVDGFTFSATSGLASKDARKAYEKAHNAVKKKKLDDALVEYRKAVELHPKYAVAWYELGRLLQFKQNVPEAREAFAKAIEADPKYINPYGDLAKLAAVEKKWDEAAGHSATLLKLNPYVSPEAYFISAVANLNLQKLDVAEEQTREALKRDEKNQNPRIVHLLAVILAQKQDIPGATEQLRAFLKLAPNSPEAATVKQQLAEFEKQLAGREGSQAQSAQ